MKTGRTNLTQLELAVVVLLSRGYRPAHIQAALGISKRAYASRRESILNKLGAANDWQAGMFVERQQLVSADERNRIEDRREERMDASRAGAQ